MFLDTSPLVSDFKSKFIFNMAYASSPNQPTIKLQSLESTENTNNENEVILLV